MNAHPLKVALIGNPNSGKTTLFNAITGSRQHVGNYPGVTVERKEGLATHDGVELHVVDLPGTYSLTARSLEEIVARNFIIDEEPDVVVDIIDASNLERNLYLATQLLELGAPLILAFNMSDLAAQRGVRIDHARLSELLSVPIVPTVGHKGAGMDELLDAVVAAGQGRSGSETQRRPNYGAEVEPHVEQLAGRLAERCGQPHHARWYAIKLLEADRQTAHRLRAACPGAAEELIAEAARLRRHIEGVCGGSAEIILADRRYGFIAGACAEAVARAVASPHPRSDKIDAVLTNRFLGLPIFAVMMYLVFQFTFAVGNPLVGLLDDGKGRLAAAVRGLGPPGGHWLVSLLADGIIEGVGAVLTFVPLIALLYAAIAVLEDTGYMARAAYVLDGLMHRIGLHGKSFIPMVIGFGCTVPAVMATRILETRRDRLVTMLVLPLMSCGARLPVYVLLLGAFFRPRTVLDLHIGEVTILTISNQALMLFGIYFIGIVLAAISTKILRSTIFRGEVTPFVMELPPYRLPTAKGLLVHIGERTGQFVQKAGTIILAVVIVLWALKSWPALGAEQAGSFERQRQALRAAGAAEPAELDARLQEVDLLQHQAELERSAIGRIGQAVAPALAPCGFDWKISTALLGAVAAKEVFIGQMGVIYAVGEQTGSLREKLQASYSPLQGLCIILFILIASPCAATVVVTMRESGSWKWAAFQWTYLTAVAWAITTAVFQLGRAAGL